MYISKKKYIENLPGRMGKRRDDEEKRGGEN
jgi:hypothetical protein